MSNSTTILPIFISGAGPTGLLLSIWLTQFNVPHRIIDPLSSTGTTSRALIVHARIIEFYDQLGFAERIIEAGTKLEAYNLTYAGKRRATIPFTHAGQGQTRFPFVLSLGQDQHEAILQDELQKRGGQVERGKKVIAVVENDSHMEVTVEDMEGKQEILRASYVAGCDGAHSAVRKMRGIKMEGGTYDRRFFVADVNATGASLPGTSILNLCLTQEDFCLAIRMKGDNRARLIGFTPDHLGDDEEISFEDCLPSIKRNLGSDTVINKLNWFSHYKVHHRHAASFRQGRVFIFGDAAHLHSPVGGQGMNTGLGDVTNFAWKFASAHHLSLAKTSTDFDDLLDTYDIERSAFAESLVSTTDTIFQYVTGATFFARLIRTFIAPYILPLFIKVFDFAPMIFNKTAQLAISYPQSALSVDLSRKGSIRAGQRLPYLENCVYGGVKCMDNYQTLKTITWQAHIFGKADWARDVLDEKEITIVKFEWTKEAEKLGFGKDTVYLIRPDGHVGLVIDETSGGQELGHYVRRWAVCNLPGQIGFTQYHICDL